MILNAHKIHIQQTGSKILFTAFVIDVVKMLVTNNPIPNNLRSPGHEDFLWLTRGHFPVIKQPTETATNKHPTKICKVCYVRGKCTNSGLPLRTAYVCGDCPSEPGLDVENCFKIYHTVPRLYLDGIFMLFQCFITFFTYHSY